MLILVYCFKFALVEHPLINIYVFSEQGRAFIAGKIKNQSEWENLFDANYQKATKKTFGLLSKYAVGIEEFVDISTEIAAVGKLRNYFAHYFLREESPYYASNEGCWLLLTKMAALRRLTISLEDALLPRFENMCRRFRIPLPDSQKTKQDVEALLLAARNTVLQGKASFGWEA
jgi:hypothetical protein